MADAVTPISPAITDWERPALSRRSRRTEAGGKLRRARALLRASSIDMRQGYGTPLLLAIGEQESIRVSPTLDSVTRTAQNGGVKRGYTITPGRVYVSLDDEDRWLATFYVARQN